MATTKTEPDKPKASAPRAKASRRVEFARYPMLTLGIGIRERVGHEGRDGGKCPRRAPRFVLPRQPGGFEGFRAVGIEVDLDDLAVSKAVDVAGLPGSLDSTGAPASVMGCDEKDDITEISNVLSVEVMVAPERPKPVSKPPSNRVAAPECAAVKAAAVHDELRVLGRSWTSHARSPAG